MIMQYGTVIGFVPNKPDFAMVTNGIFVIYAYISGDRSKVVVGGRYSLYKQNSLYYLGAGVDH